MSGTELAIFGVVAPDLLAALHAPCFADPWDTVAMADTLAVPGSFALIACLGTGDAAAPVGLAIARVCGEEGEVLTLGVLPDARGRHVGRGLMRALMGEAAKRGAQRLFLEVAEDNHAARALYAGFEACLIGRRRNYYRWPDGSHSDALVLQLDLGVTHTGTPHPHGIV